MINTEAVTRSSSTWCALAEISRVVSGTGFPLELQGKVEGSYPFAKVGDISQATRESMGRLTTAANYIDEEDLKALRPKLMPEGTVLFAKIGEAIRLNNRALAMRPLVVDNNVMGLIPDRTKVYPPYLFYFMKTVDLYPLSIATAVPSVRKSDVEQIRIPIPPLDEQHRVVVLIEEALGRTGRASSYIQQAELLIPRLRNVVFAQVFGARGQLRPEAGRKQKLSNAPRDLADSHTLWDLPPGWAWRSFGDVATVRSNLVDPASFPGALHVAPNHIESHTGKLLPCRTVAEDGVTSPKHQFEPGTILYSKIRPYLNKATIVKFGGVCSADMYPITTTLNTRYLLYWILSPQFVQWATGSQGRTVLPKINQSGLSRIPVPVPPLLEQLQVVNQLDALFASLARSVDMITSSRQQLRTLEVAILREAFS